MPEGGNVTHHFIDRKQTTTVICAVHAETVWRVKVKLGLSQSQGSLKSGFALHFALTCGGELCTS